MIVLLFFLFRCLLSVRPDPYWPDHFIKDDEIIVRNNKTFLLYSQCTKDGKCDSNSHRHARCLEHNGPLICLKRLEYRPKENPHLIHNCGLPDQNSSFNLPPDFFGANEERASLREKFLKYIACSSVSFQSACSNEFYEWLYNLMRAYKMGPYGTPEDLWPRINRFQLSNYMSLEGEHLLQNWLGDLEGEHVGFVMDAYTLHHRHQIAVLLVTPHLDRPPLLIYLVQASNEQSSYGKAGWHCEMLCRFLLFTSINSSSFYASLFLLFFLFLENTI
jgi:hypothetical protein